MTASPFSAGAGIQLSILMLLLVFGFFYQSFEEMLKIAPVQVAVERIMESE